MRAENMSREKVKLIALKKINKKLWRNKRGE